MTGQRDLYIDFLKGLCIICVILTHCLPAEIHKASAFVLWGDMAVPLFLMLQSYHVFRRADNTCMRFLNTFNWRKIWARIIKPFVLITLFTGLILIMSGLEPQSVIRRAIVSGGIGPGSYYVWIYMQFVLLLPVF